MLGVRKFFGTSFFKLYQREYHFLNKFNYLNSKNDFNHFYHD